MGTRVFMLALAAVVVALAVGGGLFGMSGRRSHGAVAACESRGGAGRFEWVDVYVKAEGWSIGAWQIELTAEKGRVAFVGVEGGEGAFAEAPAYDAAALSGGERLVIGATVKKDAGVAGGRIRVARVHVQVRDGAAKYTARLVAAGDDKGERREAVVETSIGEARSP